MLSFRSLYPRWNTIEERNRLLALVSSREYDTNFVESLLGEKRYEYLPQLDGGTRVDTGRLLKIREDMLGFLKSASAGESSLRNPEEIDWRDYNQLLYENILSVLPMNLYEASRASVWNYLTWYVLLDIAVSNYLPGSEKQIHQRFDFNRSRHVFARWWWRAEVSSHSTFAQSLSLLESDWELIFERPSLIPNPKVAGALAAVLSQLRNSDGFSSSIFPKDFERIWIKRVLRLTSQSNFAAFSEQELYERFLQILTSLGTRSI